MSDTTTFASRVPVGGRRCPALWCAVLVALGIVVGDRWGTPLVWCAVLTGLLLLSLALYGIPNPKLSTVVTAMFVLVSVGAFRIAVENAGRPHAGLLELAESRRPVELFGRIAGIPYQRSHGWRAPFELKAVSAAGSTAPLSSRLLLSTGHSLDDVRYGDYVRFRGYVRFPFIRRNPGGLDYARHLQRQGMDAIATPVAGLRIMASEGSLWSPTNLVEPARRWIRSIFVENLPPESSALLLGFLLGDTERIPQSVVDQFRDSGALHLLAVSGANVWLIVGVFFWPLYVLRVNRRIRTSALIIIVVLFAFLTRNEPSVVRAAIVVTMVMLAGVVHRPVDIINAVGSAGFLILLIAPSQLFRPGFQLSFAAVLAIAVMLRRVHSLWSDPRAGRLKRISRGILFITVSSAAASIATAPVLAAHFGTVPLVGVFSNIVMVPLAGLTAQLGVVALGVGVVTRSLPDFMTWPLQLLIRTATGVAGFFAGWPHAVVDWPDPSIASITLFYVLLSLLLAWRFRYAWMRPAVYTALALVAWQSVSVAFGTIEKPVAVALLDAGSQHIVAVALPGQEPVWFADSARVVEGTMQWTVEPFARHVFGSPESIEWNDWKTAPDGHARRSDVASIPGAGRWVRVVDTSASGGTTSIIIADVIQSGRNCVLLIRDAEQFAAKALNLAATEGTLIVPADTRPLILRALVTDLKPESVVLFGRLRYRRYPDEAVAFWRIRFPHTRFWATDLHGGTLVELDETAIRIKPTIEFFDSDRPAVP